MSLGPQCRACRQRRVRCGSEQPACSKCTLKGIQCPGYSTSTPLRWRHFLPWKSQPSMASLHKRTDDVAPGECIADALTYYNCKIVPDLSAVQTSEFKMTVNNWLGLGEADRHLHIGIVTLHKAIQQGASWQRQMPGARNGIDVFYYHQACAARTLQDQIGGPSDHQLCHNLLATIGRFLSLQIQESAYGVWRTHLNGAKAVLNMWERTQIRPSLRLDTFPYFHIMMIDLYGTTTSALDYNFSQTSIITQHRMYLDWVGNLGFNSCGTLTPVPDELLRAIIRINILRASCSGEHLTDEKETASEASPNTILHAVQQFSPSSWAENVLQPHRSNPQINGNAESWTLLATCFQSATALYLILSISQIPERDAWEQARQSAYASLAVSIRSLFDKPSPLRKFILWPMVVAGVEAAACGDRLIFEYIVNNLNMLTLDLGTMAMREASELLVNLGCEYDKQRAGAGHRTIVNWDYIFRAGPIFLM